jgi:predicted Holliday junction resolvase-like endonuclease
MDIPIIWWVVAGLAIALALSLAGTMQLYKRLKQERFRKRSLSSKYGKLTEQFLPLVEMYPWDPSSFRFLGSPIDGVQFEDDRVILVEFKTGNSQLSRLQRHIRDLVKDGKVDFEVIRVA